MAGSPFLGYAAALSKVWGPPLIDPDSGEANDSGAWFRYSGEHWIYNFSTAGMPGGTYEVHVRMPDGRLFKGGLVLR